MKRGLLFTWAILLIVNNALAQWNVSTEISNKNVLVEEFTGIHCGYCPYAHKIVAEMLKAQDDKVYAIAVHAGSYAIPNSDEPDFRIPEGIELNNHFGITGYPAGMVNRQRYTDGYITCNRNLWADYAHTQSEETAPVNLWMASSYNADTRQLTVNIEGYYTADVDVSENLLSVVITENNIMGPQSGGGVGSEYIHQHMARAWLTPTLGDTISNCKKGEYFSRQYIYNVPETINDVAVNPAELEVIAFICEDDENVLNVTGCRPDYPGLALPLEAEITHALIPIGDVYGQDYWELKLNNRSTEDITAATFTITFNKTDYDAEWSGWVPARTATTIRIPFNVTELMNETNNQYTIKLTGLNGTEYDGNKLTGKFNAPYTSTPTIKIVVATDNRADENLFIIRDMEGNVVGEIGNIEAGNAVKTSQLFNLQPNATYCFEVSDSWSNGIRDGYFEILDAYNNSICKVNEIINHGCRTFFTTTSHNVSETEENKRVLIEEFTGIHCGNCPDAHVIIDELLRAQGDVVFALAYHAGHYSVPGIGEPDYRTAMGDTLDVHFVPGGYPNGMINRYRFDDEIMYTRSTWHTYSHTINSQTAPVNLWVGSQYDSKTRTLTIDVEGYYTADVDATENFLNVVVTQSEIIGPQNGGDMGSQYTHNHMVRANITPIWGEPVTGCKSGDFFKKQYTWIVPEEINGVATDPANFEVVTFVSLSDENILNVTGCRPHYPDLVLPMVVEMQEPLIPVSGTYAYNYYEASLINKSTDDIVQAEFAITLNDEVFYTQWEGLAPARETTAIAIPFNQSDFIVANNDFEVKLIGINYEDYEGNSFYGSFQDPIATTSTNKFIIKTDNYADENRYLIKDANGKIVHEFGPFPAGTVTEITEELTLKADQIYCLEITDAWGNGIMSPRGTCKIYNADGRLVTQLLEIHNHGIRTFFATTEVASVGTIDKDNTTRVHYNADEQAITISCDSSFRATVYNTTGECVYQATASQMLNIPVATKGVYIVKVDNGSHQYVTKIIAR